MGVQGRSLSVIVHADTKVGKSTFANTAPAPRLLIDAEAANRFLPGTKVYWDPKRDWPPQADGTWETCVVIVREYNDFTRAIDYLVAGTHPFESVIVDSITEIQTKCKEQLSADGQMDQKRWGALLDDMASKVRVLRDLTEHPTRVVTAVVLTAMTEFRNEKWRPYVQGQLRTMMPYFLDIVGYAFVQSVQPADQTQPPVDLRRMLTRTHPLFEAGERVQGRVPQYVEQADFTIPRLLEMVFGPDPAAPQPATSPAPEQTAPVAQ